MGDEEQEFGNSSEEKPITVAKSSGALVDTLEGILSENGIEAQMYYPSRISGLSIAHRAILRSKKKDPRVECEVFVDKKMRKYKFTVFDVEKIFKGRSSSNVVPEVISADKCIFMQITGKGELNLVFESTQLRDEFVTAFCILLHRRGGKLLPIP